MKATLRLAPLLGALLLAGGCAPLSKTDVSRVLTSGRDGYQLPEQVIETLAIAPGSRVAEIGAGKGYWLPWLSRAVGPEGRVLAVEVEDDLVAALRERVQREGLDNVVVVRGQYADPALPDGEIDLVLTCNTYHHIDGRVPYFRRLLSDLAPGGRVVHIDERHDIGVPIRWLQSSGHWADPEEIREEMAQAGYQRVASEDFLPTQSLQVFSAARAAAAAR